MCVSPQLQDKVSTVCPTLIAIIVILQSDTSSTLADSLPQIKVSCSKLDQ